MASLKTFEGLRASSVQVSNDLKALRPQAPASAAPKFFVVAQKRVQKKTKIVLKESLPKVGKVGEIVTVKSGFFRNYLMPMGKASLATESVLTAIRRREEEKIAAALRIKNAAQELATALKVIGKFQIRKKVGENKQIFGSVTTQEVADILNLQSGQKIDKKDITMPEIRQAGSHTVTVKLHPEVFADVQIQVIGTKS
eukprot:jgi/Mesvir1/20286/Mv19895-RA.1